MDKKQFSRILAESPRDAVINLAGRVIDAYPVSVIKPPAKTLIMLTVKEPVKNSRFYMGEAIAAECLLEVAGHKGAAVILGDDFEKARAIAVLDAADSASLPVMADIRLRIAALEQQMILERRQEAALYRTTQVNFHIMEDRDAE
jgi:alpha-D-ribose 1-methylphosphonate 5-triphosphate synthase subunit PhnG